MDGKDLSAGAVAGVSIVKNPIVLARAVKDESEHVMLSSQGADAFALHVNALRKAKNKELIEIVDNGYFTTKKRRVAFEHWLETDGATQEQSQTQPQSQPQSPPLSGQLSSNEKTINVSTINSSSGLSASDSGSVDVNKDANVETSTSASSSSTTTSSTSNVSKFGTVGAVACDSTGHVAAATSTGGMMGKRYR
jgi:beta-aspartyl-peptidase (threonine type)